MNQKMIAPPNDVTLGGEMCNAKLIETKSGTQMLKGSIRRTRKDKTNDQWITVFIPFKCFGDTATYLGSLENKTVVLLKGKIDVNEFTDKNGEKRTSFEVLAFSAEKLRDARVSAPKETKVEDKLENKDFFNDDMIPF